MESECFKKSEPLQQPTQHTSKMDRPDSPMSMNMQANSGGNLMSNGQGNNKMMGEQHKNRICRDFVRGSCRRLYCKYPHVQSNDLVVFCHDYQNSKCPRINCKFLHYSVEDEDHYRKYGEFPIETNNDYNNSSVGSMNSVQDSNEYEFKSFNFSSVNNVDRNANRSIPSLLDNVGDIFNTCQQSSRCGPHCHNNDRNFDRGNNSGSIFRTGLKRNHSQDRGGECMNYKRNRDEDIMSLLRRFDEEHSALKRRVEANELKIAELRASNEYLMAQNAQLRLSTVQVSRVVNPVTVTNTQSQQGLNQPTQVTLTASPICNVSMAAPQTQIIATPPNAMNGTSIAISNTSQPTQQILGNQITLAPAALAPSMSTPINTISISTSQALQAISNGTQPIISYPIMTHSILPH